MPYIVIKSSREEIDRRELTAKVVIGRAPECDLCVKDILLSRRHCRVEETVEGWCLVDLGSKNGTSVNGCRVDEWQILSDGDVVSLGQSRMVFHTGVPGEDIVSRMISPSRPSDPNEALAGTVSGFQLILPGEGEFAEDMPCPQPAPSLPGAFDREELHSLLTAIASSSWDSIYAEARQPMRQAPRRVEEKPRRPRNRPRSPIDLSLQVSSTSLQTAVEEFDAGLEDGQSHIGQDQDEALQDAGLENDFPLNETYSGQNLAEEFLAAPRENAAAPPASRWRRMIGKMPMRRGRTSRIRGSSRMRWVAVAIWISAGGLLVTHWPSLTGMFMPESIVASPVASPRVAPVTADVAQPIDQAKPNQTSDNKNDIRLPSDPVAIDPAIDETPADQSASNSANSLFPTNPIDLHSPLPLPGMVDLRPKSLLPAEMPISPVLQMPNTLELIDLPTMPGTSH